MVEVSIRSARRLAVAVAVAILGLCAFAGQASLVAMPGKAGSAHRSTGAVAANNANDPNSANEAVAAMTGNPSLGDAAIWERRWITPIDPNLCTTEPGRSSRYNDPVAEHAFTVAAGSVDLSLAATGRLTGRWTLKDVKAPWGWLHLLPPPGFQLDTVLANGAPVVVDGDDRHLAVPLDACGGQPCEVVIRFGWEADARHGQAVGWARARDLLPRLGLDDGRLLRSPDRRLASGLPATLTLPEYAAATAVTGVAPEADWQWSIRAASSVGGADIHGQTRGQLDFSVAWPSSEEIDRVTRADVATMQACVSARTGLDVPLRTVGWQAAQPSMPGQTDSGPAPAPLDEHRAHLAGGLLSLARETVIDRHGRRAAIAHAMALRTIADAGRLRTTRGGQWLAHGLVGAVALLCATADLDSEAASDLLQRQAERVDARMAAAGDEVGAVAWSRYGGWVADYAPLAALDTVRRLTPAETRSLVETAGSGIRPAYALANTLGASRTATVLGMPYASDLVAVGNGVQSTRWRWQQGQWKPMGRHAPHWQLPSRNLPGEPPLLLDAWPGYERDFRNNRSPVSP